MDKVAEQGFTPLETNKLSGAELWEQLRATSFLEYAFLRWVLSPAVRSEIHPHIAPQHAVVMSHPEFNIRLFWLCNATAVIQPWGLPHRMWALGSI
jgi:hypothetical protein